MAKFGAHVIGSVLIKLFFNDNDRGWLGGGSLGEREHT